MTKKLFDMFKAESAYTFISIPVLPTQMCRQVSQENFFLTQII